MVPKSSTKTLAQQLRRQLLLVGIGFSIAIIISLTFITWRSVKFAGDSILKLEAHNLLQELAEDPNVELPNDPDYQAYLDWKSIPSELQHLFSSVNIKPNHVYEEEFTDAQGEQSYISFLHFTSQSGESIYLLETYEVKEGNKVIGGIIGNMLADAMWLLALIFLSLFCLVFWLLKRTNEPMKLLSNWAYKLKDNDHLSKEEFPIAELNDLAVQLKAGVDRITEYNLREQQFLKHASHEMRTPLATIQACLDTLDFQLTGSEKKTVRRALKASSNMNRLCSALLWLARESEKPIEKKTVELERFCEYQVEEHQYLVAKRDVRIDCLVESDAIEIEEDLLMIVFANLLRNACQFTGEGTIRIHITESALTIENPVAPEEHCYESSYQSFGLGLQLVERICEKLGWSFTFSERSDRVEVTVSWVQ